MLDYQRPDRGWCGDRTRGAAMGRASDLPEDTRATLHVRRVPLDGDYDPGGSYWGGGGQPLFLVWDDKDRVCYLRAADLDGAKAHFPHATWAAESGPTEGDLDDMTEAYLVAALFTGTDESDPSGGEPLDANYTTADIADETRAELRAIVEAFARENAATIAACVGKRGRHGKRECDWSLAGHCLWMVHAGWCGFTDGDWPAVEGKALEAAARNVSCEGLYVGDDGKLYAHG